MTKITENVRSLVEKLQNQLVDSKNSIHAIVCCKQHGISINNMKIIEVSCEVCDQTHNITSRSLPKVISAASAESKNLQKIMHDKATNDGGDVIKGRMISVRNKEDGNTICIIVLTHLLNRDEVNSIRSIHPSFTVSFTPLHQTKHAGEKQRTFQQMKGKKNKPLYNTAVS